MGSMRTLVCFSVVGWIGCGFSARVPDPTRSGDVAADASDPDAEVVTPGIDAAKPPDFHLRIEAFIDGESYLHIKGKTLWFENRIYAAPGRWDADGASPWDTRPILLNGTSWLPTWPDLPTPENRDCMCVSNTTTLPIGVPQAPSTTTWKEVQVRRPQGIIQYPSASNQWELIVLISDYTIGGAAQYIVEVDTKVN